MSDEALAPVSDSAPAPVASTPAPVTPVDNNSELTVSEAARLLAQRRQQRTPITITTPVEQPKAADPVEPTELAQADADPETAPSEEPEAAEPEETLPPIDPPRSWTKAEKERFQSLPRETQEYLHAREQERERDFRRSQNEIADQRKAIEAERQKAEQARKEYEAKLPTLMQTLQETGPFGDIRNMADLERLQQEDPFRFQAYQLHQWKLQAAQAEQAEVKARQEHEQQSQWAQHVQKENELAAEYIPELADKVKGQTLTQRVATELLPELGFKDSELADLASGKQGLSIYDHRVQRLLADAVKLRDIQSAPKAVATKPIPPVQRPGTAKTTNVGAAQQIQALQKQLANASGNKAAEIGAQLLRLRRASR